MKHVRDAILIAVISSCVGLAVNGLRNAVATGGLSFDTRWPDNRRKVELEFPPSYQPGDSILTLEDAYSLFLGKEAIFIDARDPSEYAQGHIKGALNLPLEQWDDYWDDVKGHLDPQREIVAYCGGLDCELSLFLARELKLSGYNKTYVFFGGWLKWQQAGLPTEGPGSD